jgi:hypothetical protein
MQLKGVAQQPNAVSLEMNQAAWMVTHRSIIERSGQYFQVYKQVMAWKGLNVKEKWCNVTESESATAHGINRYQVFQRKLRERILIPLIHATQCVLSALSWHCSCFFMIPRTRNSHKDGWTIRVLGFDSRRGLGVLFTTAVSRTALGSTQLPIQWIRGTLSLGVKRPEREADHSSPSSAEIKEWVELYLHSPIRLHGVVIS